ncbi:MAG: PAS domain S-box protein [Actinomycetota bacterium]
MSISQHLAHHTSPTGGRSPMHANTGMTRLAAVARMIFPRGHQLSAEAWRLRHRALTILLWAHIPALGLFGSIGHRSVVHVAIELVPIAALAEGASWARWDRRWRSISCALGLMSCSALLVHLSGGVIEMHFHFFVVIGLLTLYQDWAVFGVAIVYVAIHHGIVGVFDPRSVYNHPDAWVHPLKWAGIHAAFVLGASAAGIANWKLTERAQERLLRSETQLRTAQHVAQLGSWEADIASNTVTWSDELYGMFGLDPLQNDASLEAFLGLIHPDDWDGVAQRVAQALAGGEMFSFDHRILRRDGIVRVHHVRGEVILDEEGAPARVVGTAQDITERTEIEAALRRSEEHTRRIIETAHDAFVAIDETGTIIDWNRGSEKLFGWRSDEAMGRTMVDTIVPERYRDAHSRGFEHFLATGEGPVLGNRVELSALHRDGDEFPVELTIWAVRDGTSYTFNAFLRDIRERNRARDEIERARQEAETANRAKSAFLSRMSHELRTPLNAILGFGQLLQMDELSSDQGENVHQIVKAGRHLLELINEVLDISRIEEGQLSLSIEAIELRELLAECLDLVRPMANQRQIRLDASDIRAEEFLLADRQRLKQVLLNLLTNAIKYNNEGGSVRVVSEATDSSTCRVAVIDTGPGIAGALMDRLFVPFDRLGAEQSAVEGTGIGLALSRRLVEVMGGTIGAESVPAKGSTFWIELQSTSSPSFRESNTPMIAAEKADDPLRGRLVLYIEDNPSNLRLVERVLARRPQIQLLTAMQGGIGIDLAREHHPELILLDLNLPDMTGDEVLRRLKENPATDGIPVVVLSADATKGAIERLLEAGARAYITKPIDLKEVLDVIDQTLHATVG